MIHSTTDIDAHTLNAAAVAEHNHHLVAEFMGVVDECIGHISPGSHVLEDRNARIDAAREHLDSSNHTLSEAVKHAHEEVQKELDALKARWDQLHPRADQLMTHLSEGLAHLHAEVQQLDQATVKLTAAIEPIAAELGTAFGSYEEAISASATNFSALVASDLLAPLRQMPQVSQQFATQWQADAVQHATEFHGISREQEQRVEDLGQILRDHAQTLLSEIDQHGDSLGSARTDLIKQATDQFISHNDHGVEKLETFGTNIAQLAEKLTKGYQDFVAIVKDAQDLSDEASGALGSVSDALGSMGDSFEALRI
jgi:DNA repair exonuclease SbcCD ATPase subunit